jgi:hypothetical protein
MDPHLESQGFWLDFHTTLLTYCRRALTAVLPRHYAALIEARISLVDLSEQAELQEIRHRWIEIKRLPDRSLVTVIEILSPSNKIGSGRAEYIEKRNQWLKQPVNVVEIDLLIGGHRLPVRGLLPTGDCYAFVSRSSRRPNCDVYAWSIRRTLPEIPIPLADPDADIPLDLATVFAQTYDDARYDGLVNYSAPLALPLALEDLAWSQDQAHGFAERSEGEH